MESDYLPEIFCFSHVDAPGELYTPGGLYTLPRGGVWGGLVPPMGVRGGPSPPAGGSGGQRSPGGGLGAAPLMGVRGQRPRSKILGGFLAHGFIAHGFTAHCILVPFLELVVLENTTYIVLRLCIGSWCIVKDPCISKRDCIPLFCWIIKGWTGEFLRGRSPYWVNHVYLCLFCIVYLLYFISAFYLYYCSTILFF